MQKSLTGSSATLQSQIKRLHSSLLSLHPLPGLAQEHGLVLLGFKLFSFPSQGPLKYICLSLYLSSFSLVNDWEFFRGLFRYGRRFLNIVLKSLFITCISQALLKLVYFLQYVCLDYVWDFQLMRRKKPPTFSIFRKLSEDLSDGVVSYTGVLMDLFHGGEMSHADKVGSEHQTEDIEQKRGDR